MGEKGVKLTDRFTFDKKHDVVERFVSKIEPDISTRGIVYINGVAIKYDAELWEASVSSEPTSKEGVFCYMIDLKPMREVNDFTFIIGEFK